jgi:hypothetical protein
MAQSGGNKTVDTRNLGNLLNCNDFNRERAQQLYSKLECTLNFSRSKRWEDIESRLIHELEQLKKYASGEVTSIPINGQFAKLLAIGCHTWSRHNSHLQKRKLEAQKPAAQHVESQASMVRNSEPAEESSLKRQRTAANQARRNIFALP